jgi:hypothetical protein
MKKTCLLAVVSAIALSLMLVACTSGGESTEGSVEEATVAQLSDNVVEVSLDPASSTIESEVTIKDGESFTVASKLISGEAVVVAKFPQGEYSDYAYEGCSASQTEVDPGTYAITVKPSNASGVIYILSYPTGQLDVTDADNEALYKQVAEYARSAS